MRMKGLFLKIGGDEGVRTVHSGWKRRNRKLINRIRVVPTHPLPGIRKREKSRSERIEKSELMELVGGVRDENRGWGAH